MQTVLARNYSCQKKTRSGQEDISSGCEASCQHLLVQKQIPPQRYTGRIIRDESDTQTKYAGIEFPCSPLTAVTGHLSFFLVSDHKFARQLPSGRKASEVFEVSGAEKPCVRDQHQADSVQCTGPLITEVTIFLKMVGKSWNKNLDPLFYLSAAGDF